MPQSKSFWNYLDRALGHIANIFFIGFFICVILQVLFRYVLQVPLTWSEEASRYFNMFSVFFAAATGVFHKEHLRVDLVDKWLSKAPARIKMGFYFIATLLSAISAVVLLIGCLLMTKSTWGVSLTMIPLPQGILYLGGTFCAGLMTLFFLRQLVQEGIKLGKGAMVSGEEDVSI